MSQGYSQQGAVSDESVRVQQDMKEQMKKMSSDISNLQEMMKKF